jgi:hypothetical protein
MEAFLDEQQPDIIDNDPQLLASHLQDFSFTDLRNKGVRGCGYDEQPRVETATNYEQNGNNDIERNENVGNANNVEDSHFVQYSQDETPKTTSADRGKGPDVNYSIRNIVTALLSKLQPKARSQVFKNNPEIQTGDANGSIASIIE